MTISPESNGIKPVRRLMSVLFPDPFGPITPVILPFSNDSESLFTALTPSKCFSICLVCKFDSLEFVSNFDPPALSSPFYYLPVAKRWCGKRIQRMLLKGNVLKAKSGRYSNFEFPALRVSLRQNVCRDVWFGEWASFYCVKRSSILRMTSESTEKLAEVINVARRFFHATLRRWSHKIMEILP